MCSIRNIVLLFFVFLINNINAQQYYFRNYSLDEGLPQSEVYDILEDERGYIWVTTNGGGICRFNGLSFKQYTTDDGLANNLTRRIIEDRQGNIWIGTFEGLSKYDGLTFTNYNEKDGLENGVFLKLYEDTKIDGKIWMHIWRGTHKRFVYSVNKNKVKRFDIIEKTHNDTTGIRFFYQYKNGNFLCITRKNHYVFDGENVRIDSLKSKPFLKNKQYFPIYEDNSGNLFLHVRDNESVAIYTYNNDVFTKFDLPDYVAISRIRTMMQDSHSDYWFTDGYGVMKYSRNQITRFTQDNGLPNNIFIAEIFEDTGGNIWFVSRGSGITKYSGNRFVAFTTEDGLLSDIIRSIYQDSKGNYWFGTTGRGIAKYDGKQITNYLTDQKKYNFGRINSMTEWQDDKLLLATDRGMIAFDGKDVEFLNDYFQLPKHALVTNFIIDTVSSWFCMSGIGIAKRENGKTHVFTTANSDLASGAAQNVLKDSKGNIWICTDYGITRYYDGVMHKYDSVQTIKNQLVLQAAEDKFGQVWFATFSKGLTIFDGNDFRQVKVCDGLSSNIVYSVLCDDFGNIWAGTQRGVDKIMLNNSGKIIRIRHYGKYEGFTGEETNAWANYKDSKGNLWFGTIHGVMRYNPQEDKPDLTPPITKIIDIRLFFKEIDWISDAYKNTYTKIDPWFSIPINLQLPYHKNHISFGFEAISYRTPEKVKYQWMLEGLDEEWSPVTNKTEAVYANLAPGNYVFKVRSCNSEGVWNEQPATYSFEILTPFWQQWWFKVTIGALVVAIAFFVFKMRLRSIENKKKELERIVKEKTFEIREQNEEILAQNMKLEQQKEELEQQKEEILVQATKLKKAYQNLALLNEIGMDITTNLMADRIIDVVYENVNSLMDAAVFGIGIYNSQENAIVFKGVKERGITLEPIYFYLNEDDRFAVYCFQNQEEVFINDVETEYKKYASKLMPVKIGEYTSSIMYVPLSHKKRAMGVITVQSFQKNAYRVHHLNLLRNIALYTKIALDNAYAYKQIEIKTQKLEIANANVLKQKEQIESKNNELIELNKDKNHLIGVVAHDLRNPLTSALSITQMLQSMDLDEDAQESLTYLANSLKRMNDMVTKILDIRVIEAKKINIQLERLNLVDILRNVYANFREKAEEKQIAMELSLPLHEVPAKLDQNYVSQVYENLVSNAIKFSPPEKNIYISLKEINGKVRTEVIDEGPGISTEDKEKLFGKFQKLSAKPTGNETSTGLGLSIVKKYVEAMNGKVWCESDAGKGASFIVEFNRMNTA